MGNFVAEGHPVPSGHGWTWIAGAWKLFKRQPGTWVAIAIIAIVVFIAHEVIRDKNNDGDDGDGDPGAGLAFEELPGAGDPRPAVAARHGMAFRDEIAHDRPPPLATCPSILLSPWQSPWPPASRPRFSPRRRRRSCCGRSSAPAPRRAAVRRCRRR